MQNLQEDIVRIIKEKIEHLHKNRIKNHNRIAAIDTQLKELTAALNHALAEPKPF